MTLYPNPFQPHPKGDWETIWRPIALVRIKDALRRLRLGQISEDELRQDRNPSGIKRWLWYMHHPDGVEGERWKNIGRPYWSHDAYTTFRKYFYLIPEAERFARDGAPARSAYC